MRPLSIRAIPSLSEKHQRWQFYADDHYRPLIRKNGPITEVYSFTMGSSTSYPYWTAVSEPRQEMCRSVQYPKEFSAQTMILIKQNASYPVIIWGWLRVPCSLQIFMRLSSVWRIYLDSSVIRLPNQTESNIYICWSYLFNLAPLDTMYKGTQTHGTRTYRPFMCSFRRTVVTNIVLPMATAFIDVTCVEVDRFRWAKQ